MLILTRREALGSLLAVTLLRRAQATPERLQAAIRDFVGEAELRPGRVRLDIPPLVENGNAVPVSVVVESPMTEADHVRAIGLFNERNPQPHVLIAHIG